MTVWNIDAGDIRDETAFDNELLYRTSEIDDFLDTKRDNLFFVTATKGLGKTFVLKAKSINYTRNGIPLLHANILVEKPGGGSVIFDKEKINLFSNVENWANLWTLAIYIACIKRLNLTEEIKGYSSLLDRIISLPAKNITSNFKIILNLSVSDFYSAIEELNNVLSPFVETTSKTFAAFIDNVDEYFEKHISDNKFSSKSSTGQTAKSIWYLSQIGLIESIYQITSKNPHLKIFASIRKEVFIKLSDSDSRSLQYKGSSIELNYSMENIQDIFILNIKKEKEERLSNPSLLSHNPIYAFLGVENVSHKYVEGESEPVFDYIFRHTLQRPRDLMMMGRNISHIPVKERNMDRLQREVNNTSTEIAVQYIKEVSPHIEELDFKSIFKRIKSNILSSSEIMNICSEYNNFDCTELECKTCGGVHVFCSLYAVGLLGYGEDDLVKKEVVQKFLPTGMKSFDIPGKLPRSNYYLIHPCLYGPILKENSSFEPNKTNIVAPGYNLNSFLKWSSGQQSKRAKEQKILSLPKMVKPCHLHFGAGQLGLGLVVPLFSERSRVVVLQRPSDHWKKIKNCEEISLTINNKLFCNFTIIHDQSKNKGIEWLLNQWENGSNLLVCSGDHDLIKLLIENADSFSTSLKTGLDYITNLFLNVNLNKSINLFPFENDRTAVCALTDNLRRINNMVNVVPVMADKICSQRTIGSCSVNITAEKYQEVNIHGANKNVFKLFKDLDTVNITACIEAQNFYYKRKYYIVNGIHMIAAIYGYLYLYDKKIPFGEWKNYHINVLLGNKNFLDKLFDFVKIQSLRLLLENEKSLLFEIYGTDSLQIIFNSLLDYGKQSIQRFEDSVDHIVRILDIDDVKQLETKFKGRIENMSTFIVENIDAISLLELKDSLDSENLYKTSLELNRNVANLFMQIILNKN